MEQPKNLTGPNLRKYREKTGLTYAALSRELLKRGSVISPRRLKGIEEQTSPAYVNDLVIFAHFFGVRIAELFEE